MPHRKIRRVREAVQEKKQAARDVAKRAGATKRRAKRAVAKRTNPIEDEAKQSVREAKLLGKEVKEPVSRAVKGGSSAARTARKQLEGARKRGAKLQAKAAAIDEKMGEVRAIEQDTLGMAGEDFGMDLEIVDDVERGEHMEGMGDVGLDVTFDDAPGGESAFSLTDDVDDDLLGSMEGEK